MGPPTTHADRAHRPRRGARAAGLHLVRADVRRRHRLPRGHAREGRAHLAPALSTGTNHGHLLANGHLLYGGKIMDDLERFEGWRRFKGGAVLEVDWTPQRQRPSAGHRGERDDVRRLRRRDDDGRRRRIFEVTRDGVVVWEYVSPHFFHEPSGPGFNNWVIRAFRYTAEEIEAARR